MVTTHQLHPGSAARMAAIADESVGLVVTSPPYPMIEMWDESFFTQSEEVRGAWRDNRWLDAYEHMHEVLDACWKECWRVLVEGGILCINIGDATRTLGGQFRLFPNHARIIQSCLQAGFQCLPHIIWRKPTNAPNKFMGSGTLPPGAYVTLEHEYILVFRKGNKRIFRTSEEKQRRARSAFFWEERNMWFSDLWHLAGTRQQLTKGYSRARSGAFPFEIPWRLIHMFSIQGDTILDPFVGTGTTMLAAMAAGRSSAGVELDASMARLTAEVMDEANVQRLADENIQRLQSHISFVEDAVAKGKVFKYENETYGFAVMTRQERALALPIIEQVTKRSANEWQARYTFDWKEKCAGKGIQLTFKMPL